MENNSDFKKVGDFTSIKVYPLMGACKFIQLANLNK